MGFLVTIVIAFFGALIALWRWLLRRILRFEDRDLPDDTEVPGQRVELAGARIHYVDHGQGDAIVLLHGLSASTFSWRKNIEPLAQRFRVVALDMLGFGMSERGSDADHSLSAHAGRVVMLMDRLGIGRATVVGHSLGGAAALYLAERHPERVSRLVLISSATPREARLLALGRYFPRLTTLYYGMLHNSGWLTRRLFEALYYDPSTIPDGVLEEYLSASRIRSHHKTHTRLRADMAEDPPLKLKEIRTPVLILWGAGDRLLRASRGRWLQKQLPNAELIVVPETAHMLPEENAELVNRAIAEFAASGRAEEVPA
jgi:pimeloyl-ACP methyl ester carboxylesterase